MMATISAWAIEREVPGYAANEWQTVTEYILEAQALYPARPIAVELAAYARLGAYRQASVNVTHTEAERDDPCILVDNGGGFNRGEQAFSLEAAISLGHARLIA
jgi:hypothetical protein